MIRPPGEMGAYQFAVLSSLRAAQLMRGCTPRVDAETHKPITVAQLEVAGGHIEASERNVVLDVEPAVGSAIVDPAE
jgi:DNA-directed RNA polymerase subunit K/omega